jgi:tetratricopeptide (TPR) repeat protein
MRPQSRRGPRGADASEEDINGYDNLLLLCPNHHKEVDGHRNAYPIERLRKIKADHEAWVQLVLETAMGSDYSLFTLPGTHRKNPYFIPKKEVTAAISSFRAGDALVLSGPPGIGKTQHAVQHAHETRSRYGSVLWVQAESIPSLHRALATLADQLLITETDNSIQDKLVAFRQWLAAKPAWLLILDNADLPEVAREIEKYIPAAHNGYVLITSQVTDWTPAFRMERIDVWTETESLVFLTRRLPQFETAIPALAQLASGLGGLPLAIEHAAAYITETSISVNAYLDFLNRDRRSVFGRRYPGMTDYRASIAATWQISVRRLSWLARQILHYASCLAAEPIPRSILSHFVESVSVDHTYGPFERRQLQVALKPPDVINLALAELGRFSLVSLSEDSFRLHPLLQQVVLDSGRVRPWQARYWLYRVFAGKPSHWLNASGLWLYRTAFLLNLKGVLPEYYGSHAELLKMQRFIGHLQALVRNSAAIAPELHVLEDGAWIGGVAPLNRILEWAEEKIKLHQSGMSAIREMLERNARGAPDLISETEWFLSHVEELFGQVVETGPGGSLVHILRRLADETPVRTPRQELYSFLWIIAQAHAEAGAISIAKRLFHFYRAHAMKDPDAPVDEAARARLEEALSLWQHLPEDELRELLEEALVVYERNERTNFRVCDAICIYSSLAKTPETQARARVWIRNSLPSARKWLEFGVNVACFLTMHYVHILQAQGELDEALSECEETLRLAIKSRKLTRRAGTALLWERRGLLLYSRKRYSGAARSYARCLALVIACEQPSPFRRIHLHYMTAIMHFEAGSVSAASMHIVKIHDLLKIHWSDDPPEAEKWAAAVGFTPGLANEDTYDEARLSQALAGATEDSQTVRRSDE